MVRPVKPPTEQYAAVTIYVPYATLCAAAAFCDGGTPLPARLQGAVERLAADHLAAEAVRNGGKAPAVRRKATTRTGWIERKP